MNNIDSILAAADAVMVARGDLGVEIDFTELPGIQKNIIERSFSFGKPIVTATQMLDSMMVNPAPPAPRSGRGKRHLRRHLCHHAVR